MKACNAVPAALEYHERAKAARARMKQAAMSPRRPPMVSEGIEPVPVRKRSILNLPGIAPWFTGVDERWRWNAKAAWEDSARALLKAENLQYGRSMRDQIKRIIREVAAISGISVELILSQRRTAPLVKARAFAMWRAAVEAPHFSLTQIGRRFGKDHTSILAARDKTIKRITAGEIPQAWLETIPKAADQ